MMGYNKKIYVKTCLFGLSIFGSILISVGDYDGYLNLFNQIPDFKNLNEIDNVNLKIQKTFILLGVISKEILNEYHWFRLIISLIFSLYLWWIYKEVSKNHKTDPTVFILLHYCFVFFILQTWYIRQGLSAVIIIYGLLLIDRKRLFFAFINITLAITIHYSAVVVFILAYLIKILPPKFIICLLIISVLTINFQISILSKIEYLLEYLLQDNINPIKIYKDSEWDVISNGISISNMIIIASLIFILKRQKFLFRNQDNLIIGILSTIPIVPQNFY